MKSRTIFTWLAPVCTAAVLITACDRNRNMGVPATSVQRSTGQRVDDKQLSTTVQSALEENRAYKFPDVKVNTYDGRVQLSGFVATRDQKNEAEAIANRLVGSGNVENKITVRP